MDFRWHSWSISVDKVTTGPAGIRYSSALYDVPTRATFESSRGVCQQGIDNIGEIPVWPSWTRIEPCAWYHRRISGSCLRKSGRYPSRPGAETPARWRKRLVCMRPGRANRAFNQYRSLAPNAPPFLGRVSRLDRLLAGNRVPGIQRDNWLASCYCERHERHVPRPNHDPRPVPQLG
jgi:hypothetical protein